MKAVWKGQIIAESDDTIVVEGNHYFPPDAIAPRHFSPSDKRTFCGWKGEAHYYDIIVDDDTNPAAAWFYPQPMDAAGHIRDYVAFWNGVEVTG
jgi:uncharacterized protein (DUF427 family)